MGGEEDEEAAAWAAFREAFADDEASLGQLPVKMPSTPPRQKPREEPAEEAADEVVERKPPPRLPSTPPRAAPKAGKNTQLGKRPLLPPTAGAEDEDPPQGKTSSNAKRAAIEEPDPLVDSDDWLQEQVDKLVGELQRLVNEPFDVRLLQELWALPLEEQHDVLLGASGYLGKLEAPSEKAALLWSVIQAEVDARSPEPQPPTTAPLRPTATAGLLKTRPLVKGKGASKGGAAKGGTGKGPRPPAGPPPGRLVTLPAAKNLADFPPPKAGGLPPRGGARSAQLQAVTPTRAVAAAPRGPVRRQQARSRSRTPSL
eukprot:TRINITY_DN44009_c0_g1_i1.p1 TRINITY_DN44009_c0_g1~~TRINITY_DN44009_c0_g1_i1.p1  ORF type:complete len:337 (+),score=80.48 TRINITY_DN44009_c0_g1_i1:70-1011(+)